MEKARTHLRRVRYNLKHNFFSFENILLFVAIALCLGWTYGAITSMSRNWQLSRTLLEKQYELKILEVANLEFENKYYASEEYQELSARKKLNKKRAGETMVYLSKNSDEAKNKHQKIEQKSLEKKSNLSEWLAFLFGI